MNNPMVVQQFDYGREMYWNGPQMQSLFEMRALESGLMGLKRQGPSQGNRDY